MAIEHCVDYGCSHVDVSACYWEIRSLIIAENGPNLINCVNFAHHLTQMPDNSVSEGFAVYYDRFPVMEGVGHIEHKHHEEHDELVQDRSLGNTVLSVEGLIVQEFADHRRYYHVNHLRKQAFFHQ